YVRLQRQGSDPCAVRSGDDRSGGPRIARRRARRARSGRLSSAVPRLSPKRPHLTGPAEAKAPGDPGPAIPRARADERPDAEKRLVRATGRDNRPSALLAD